VQEREQIQHAILEATDQSIVMIDLNGIILMTNQVGAKRLNKEPKDFLGVCVYDLFPPELARSRKAIIDKIVQTGKPISFQDEREGIIFDNNLYPIFYRDGHIHYVVLYARDITLQKNTEIALQESEEKYRALAEVSQDLIFIVDTNDKIQYVNTNAARRLGREPEQLIGENQSEFFPPDIAALQFRSIHETIQSGKPKYEERWSKFGSGPDTYVSTWLVPLNIPSLGAPAALGVSRDITAIKNAEEDLKNSHVQLEQRVAERTWELNELSAGMRRLARKVITAQEEERRRISRELHDNTGQILVTLKYSLTEFLGELPSGNASLSERITQSIRAVDEVSASIRAIAHSLRPPLLDAGGLNISLKDFCLDLASRTKIKVHYRGVELSDVPDDIAVTLYRFVQEAFSNVLKHSHATSVSVKMQYDQQQIIVSVSDNGLGTQDPQDTTGIGLVGLRERVGFLGGELLIDASPGKGTRIKASIPWNPDNS
jgi:PAS domain S-box-containing protein